MELNNEEILTALEEFNRLHSGDLSTVLEQYLSRVAANGITLFPWCKLKPLLRHKLDLVLKDFQQRCPVDGQTPCPNVENIKFDEMHERLLTSLDQFTGTPFTIQRLCELVTNPTKHYKKTDKFMRGIEKNLAVVTTVDTFGNRIVSESKSLVNGLESADGDRSSTPDMFGSGVTTSSVTSDHFESPYIPSAPMNSPSGTPSGTSSASAWFTAHASNSGTSYQSWQQEHGSAEKNGNAADSGVWSPFESNDADGEGPSPTKRIFLQDNESKKASDDLMPMASVAPLLGQLLNSSEDAGENVTNGLGTPSIGVDSITAAIADVPVETGESLSTPVSEEEKDSTEIGPVNVTADESVQNYSVSESETSEALVQNSQTVESDALTSAADTPMVNSDIANMSLEMSFGTAENSEASCTSECVVEPKLVDHKPGETRESVADCDSTGSVSTSNGVLPDSQSVEFVSVNSEVVSTADENLMETE